MKIDVIVLPRPSVEVVITLTELEARTIAKEYAVMPYGGSTSYAFWSRLDDTVKSL